MLSHDEQLKSIRAVKKAISPLESFMGTADITVVKSGTEFLTFSNMGFQTGYHIGFGQYEISIYWEEKIDNYKGLGLYGRYNTNFNLMECKKGKLIIHSDDHDIIITPNQA